MKNEEIEILLDVDKNHKRIDVFIQQELEKRKELFDNFTPSRSQIANWIGLGRVLVNNKKISKNGQAIVKGQKVLINIPQAKASHLEAENNIPFEIVYEDAELIVINKPAGLIVHPGAGAKKGTLVNGLLAHLGSDLKKIGNSLRPGIVHRLDKDTTGLMVVAKTENAFQDLVGQLKPPRTMKREYLALCYSLPKKKQGSMLDPSGDSGKIDLPLGRHPKIRTKMAVLKAGGKKAVTNWKIEKIYKHAILIRAILETGRTHQIRVHFSHAGANIVGDTTYGQFPLSLPKQIQNSIKNLSKQTLHAYELSFIHPTTKKHLKFKARIPKEFAQLIERFK